MHSVRYPKWILTDEQLDNLLTYTGGIGSLIHDVWNALLLQLGVSVEPPGELHGLPLPDKLAKIPLNRSRIAVSAVAGQPSLIALVQAILSSNAHHMEAARKAAPGEAILPCLGIPGSRAVAICGSQTVLDTMLDGRLIYRDDVSGMVPLAVSADALAVSARAALRDYILYAAVRLMVGGISDEEAASGVVDVNAGHALESLVRPRITDVMPE